eukprot:gene8198-1460_t
MDRGIIQAALLLEEAWAWGFDVDVWRAHLSLTTWSEILRELAIVASAGTLRARTIKESKARLGVEGEDLREDPETGDVKLKLPSRFAPGTVKAAAWQVLSEEGPSGLAISEVARRIQKYGLRDLSSSKTPEASIGGSLSRDRLFIRVAPATYTLLSIVKHHKRLMATTRAPTPSRSAKAENKVEEEVEEEESATVKDEGVKGGPDAGGEKENKVRMEGVEDVPSSQFKMSNGGEEKVAADNAQVKKEEVAEEKVAADEAQVKKEEVAEEKVAIEVKPEASEAAAHAAANGNDANAAAAEPAGGDKMDVDVAKTDVDNASKTALEPAAANSLGAEPKAKELEPADATSQGAEPNAKDPEPAGASSQGAEPKEQGTQGNGEDSSFSESEDEDEEEMEMESQNLKAGEPWVTELANSDFDGLDLKHRVAALAFLCHLTLDGPTLRAKMDIRAEEGARIRKQLMDDNEKKNRQSEITARCKAAQEEASRKMEEMQYDAMVNGSEVTAEAKAAVEEEYQRELDAANHLDSEEAERIRLEERMETLFKAEISNAIRMEPLGMDRRYNRYWRLIPGACSGAALQIEDKGSAGLALEDDPCVGRIWLEATPPADELVTRSTWRLITTPEQLDGLKECLETRGLREGGLHLALQRVEKEMLAGMALAKAKPLAVSLADLGREGEERSAGNADGAQTGGEAKGEAMDVDKAEEKDGDAVVEKSEEQKHEEKVATLAYLSRLEELVPQAPCSRIRSVKGRLSLKPGLDPRALKLKRDLLMVLAGLPDDATTMEKEDRYDFTQEVAAANDPLALRDCLASLEVSIAPGRLSPYFPTANEQLLVRGAWLPVGREVASAIRLPNGDIQRLADEFTGMPSDDEDEQRKCALVWLPPTYAALSLRLASLDAAIQYEENQIGREHLAGYRYIIRLVQPADPNTSQAPRAAACKPSPGEGPGGGASGEAATPMEVEAAAGAAVAPEQNKVLRDSKVKASGAPWVIYGASVSYQGRVQPPAPSMFPMLPPAVMAVPRQESVVNSALSSGVLDSVGRPTCSGRQAHVAPQIIKVKVAASKSKGAGPTMGMRKGAAVKQTKVKAVTKKRRARGDDDSGAEDYGPGYDDGLGEEDDPFGLNEGYA